MPGGACKAEPAAMIAPNGVFSTLTILNSLVFSAGATLTGLASLALSTLTSTSIAATIIGSASSYVSQLYASTCNFVTVSTNSIASRVLQISNPLNSVTPNIISCIGYSAPYSRNMYQIGTSTNDYNLVLSSQAGYLVKYPGPFPVVVNYLSSPSGVTTTLWTGGVSVQQFGFNCGTFNTSNGLFTAAYDGLYNFYNFLVVSNTPTITDIVLNVTSSNFGIQRIGTIIRPTTGSYYLSLGVPFTTFLPAGGTIYFTLDVLTSISTSISLLSGDISGSSGAFSRLQIWRH